MAKTRKKVLTKGKAAKKKVPTALSVIKKAKKPKPTPLTKQIDKEIAAEKVKPIKKDGVGVGANNNVKR